MKAIFLFVILSLYLGMACSNNRSLKHLDYVSTVEEGDSQIAVIEKMHGMPDQIIIPDSIYLFQKEVKDITTFVYKLPRFSSSDIYIYFKDCSVLDIYHDNLEWKN